MSDLLHGITICPSCEIELDTVAVSGDKPTQSMDQECSRCDYEASIDICWYPDGQYIVFGKSDADVSCEKEGCSNDDVYVRTSTIDPVPKPRCILHLRVFERATVTAIHDSV